MSINAEIDRVYPYRHGKEQLVGLLMVLSSSDFA
jgi:hypothetical protein